MRTGTRFKGFFISIVVLALSAGVVFAGQALPSAAQPGLERASEAAGFDVPVARGNQSDEDEVVEEAPEDRPDGDADEAADEDETALEVEVQEAWDNHGAMVSEAAHMTTPQGFRNHGHFVSCVAHMDFRPEPGAEPLDLAALTPEDCDEDAEETDEEADETDETPVEEEPTEEVESAWDNHGDLVSTAAQMDAPDGFRNHGHFVSCVAHVKDLAAAPDDLSTLTPEDCNEAEAEAAEELTAEGATADKAKGKGKAKDKSRHKEQHHNKGKGKGKGRR